MKHYIWIKVHNNYAQAAFIYEQENQLNFIS